MKDLNRDAITKMKVGDEIFIGYLIALRAVPEQGVLAITEYAYKQYILEIRDEELFNLMADKLKGIAKEIMVADNTISKFYLKKTETGWTMDLP